MDLLLSFINIFCKHKYKVIAVTIYLIDVDSKGTRYAFICNKIYQMYVIPCSKE